MNKLNIKNKLVSIVLIIAGALPALLDNDGTALILFAAIAIPLFFMKKNCFYD